MRFEAEFDAARYATFERRVWRELPESQRQGISLEQMMATMLVTDWDIRFRDMGGFLIVTAEDGLKLRLSGGPLIAGVTLRMAVKELEAGESFGWCNAGGYGLQAHFGRVGNVVAIAPGTEYGTDERDDKGRRILRVQPLHEIAERFDRPDFRVEGLPQEVLATWPEFTTAVDSYWRWLLQDLPRDAPWLLASERFQQWRQDEGIG